MKGYRIQYIFMFVALLFVSCHQDGPCGEPYKWKLEYNSSESNLNVEIKKNKINLKVYGEGELIICAKNQKQILNFGYMLDNMYHDYKDERACDIKVDDEVIGNVEIVDNRVILQIFKPFKSSNIIRLYCSGIESSGDIYISSIL